MKARLVSKKSISVLLPLSLMLGVSLGIAKTKPQEVSGYSASSLPTTIDLNDTSAANIRSYYSTLNNLSTSERQGTNLLKNLKTILKNGQKYYSYENGTSIWQMYEITDRDWDKSPASSTTYGTYNSSTNKITNYTYGTSSSSSKNNPYIHALYINRDVNNQTTAWDNHNQDQWGINREHVWPKAEGFDSSGAGGARGDPMHLMAGNGYANNIHSNYYYGYVKTSSSYTDCGSKYSNQSGNLRGTSKTLNSGTVFEPQDCDKGDIARAIFYMVARYNYLSGSDSDGIDTNNPNLTLTQNISDWSSSGYTSSTSTQGKLGVLTDLLAWHHADPVDEYEIHRNNLLYTNFTNNRNPFIDFPEWVDFIWGTANYNGTTYQSYSSTPTGYATPNSDTINGYNSGGGADPVSVTGVSLNKNSTSIAIGESEVLHQTISPSNATNQAVSWSSSNNNIASVSSSGRVTAVAEGNCTITVTTSDGSHTATCTVTVTASGGGSSSSSDTIDNSKTSSTLSGTATNSWHSDFTITLTNASYYIHSMGLGGGSHALQWNSNGYLYSENNTDNLDIKSVEISATSGKTLNIYLSNTAWTSNSGTGSESGSIEGSGTFTPTGSYKYLLIKGVASSTQVSSIVINYGTATPTNPTSIIASVNTTFNVGDTITKSDVSLKDDLGNTINDFTFSNYTFTYEDTPGGGNTSYEKDFDIEYSGMETTLTVDVSRKSHVAYDSSLEHTGSEFLSAGISDSYTENQTATVDGISFIVDGYVYNNTRLCISKAKTNAAGKVINSLPYPTGITNVTVSGATVDIQLSEDGSVWTNLATATTSTTDYYYLKVYCSNVSQSSYININSISVTLKQETPANVANYVMFEDTANQCTTKFSVAKGYFESLTKAQRNTFMTSSDYVISTARARLQAWARSLGKTITQSNGDYVISSVQYNVLNLNNQSSVDYPIIIMISLLVAGTGFIIGCYFVKRKKEEK